MTVKRLHIAVLVGLALLLLLLMSEVKSIDRIGLSQQPQRQHTSSFDKGRTKEQSNNDTSSIITELNNKQRMAENGEEFALSSACENCTCPEASLVALSHQLRDIHIVMIGDSLMRYQYLSLVYRLRHGVWFDDSKWYYHLVNEKSFADPYHDNTWGAFLYHTNRILQPYEVCDCYRKSTNSMDEIVENRYYHDPILNNSVVYLLSYGHVVPIVGRLAPDKVWHMPPHWQRQAFQEYGGLAWQYSDWSKVIVNHVQHLHPQPQFVVLNAGIWRHNFGLDGSGKYPTRSTTDLFQVMNNTSYQYVWRTTTFLKKRYQKGIQSDLFMCEHLPLCVNVSFTLFVRKEFYWDKQHFLEPVYRAMNEEMLHEMGYLPLDYARMRFSTILE